MRARLIYLGCWFVGCVLLFFCFFGRVDPDGTTVGWLMVTRQGWLWMPMALYWVAVGITLIPWLFMGDPEDRRGD